MKRINKVKLATMIILAFVLGVTLIKGPIFSKADNTMDTVKEVDKEDMELFAENYSKMRLGKDNYEFYKTNYPDGCQMRISVAGYETLDGEKYIIEPIVPDIDTDMPLQDAMDFLSKHSLHH